MSYTSPITTLPQILRQPIGIAVLASLGVHGLLWAALPRLHAFSNPEADQQQRTVGLVELTPAEQNRLPQAATPGDNTSQVTLPPFAMQPSVLPPNVLPPMPPPLPSGLLNPPGLSFPLNATPLYNYPIRISPRSQALQVPVYPSPQNQKFVSQPKPPSKTPSKRPLYELHKGTKFKQYSPPSTDIMRGIQPGSLGEIIGSPPPSASPSASPSAQQANTSLRDAAGDLSKTLVGGKKLKSIRISSPVYPKAACPKKSEGLAVTTVEISSTGQISGSPGLNKSTGDDILDRSAVLETKALIETKHMAFEPDFVYAIGINYKYNSGVCSSTKG